MIFQRVLITIFNKKNKLMKKILSLFLILSIISGCKNDEESILFTLPIRNINFEIPAGINPIKSHYFVINDVPTFFDDLMKSNHVNIEDVASIIPVSAKLIQPFTDVDYDFAYEVAIKLCDNQDDEDCNHEIFWRKPVPEDIGSQLDIVPNEINMKEILSKDKIKIQIVFLQMRTTTTEFFNNQLELNFEVRRKK